MYLPVEQNFCDELDWNRVATAAATHRKIFPPASHGKSQIRILRNIERKIDGSQFG